MHKLIKIMFLIFAALAEIVLIILKGFSKTELFAIIVLAGVLIILPDFYVIQNSKKKRDRLKYGLADFMDRVAILLDSGMPLWTALSSATINSNHKEPFSAEMVVTVQSFSGNGGYFYRPEECLEHLAERCSTLSVSSFVSVVIQNSRKGSEELSAIFKAHSASCRIEQRNMAKKRAEEASTLMLIPTAIVFVAILALVATPAIITVVSGLSV